MCKALLTAPQPLKEKQNLSTESRAWSQTQSGFYPQCLHLIKPSKCHTPSLDLCPGWRRDPRQVASGHGGERNRVGAESRLPGAGDRCACQFSSSKLLRTEAENKHLGFRDDIPRYQPLANSSSYIRGQDTAVPALRQVGCQSGTGTEDERRGE